MKHSLQHQLLVQRHSPRQFEYNNLYSSEATTLLVQHFECDIEHIMAFGTSGGFCHLAELEPRRFESEWKRLQAYTGFPFLKVTTLFSSASTTSNLRSQVHIQQTLIQMNMEFSPESCY